MKDREIYYSPDISTVYKCSKKNKNETNQKYYYKSHVIDYLSKQFTSITSNIGRQQEDVKKSLSYQIEHKSEELLSKFHSQAVFQEKVKKEIKNEIHELVDKLNQLEEIQEQVSGKLQQDIADTKTYLSDKQSSQYKQLSEEINQRMEEITTSQCEKYKMIQELFVRNLNEVKEQVTVQGQVNRDAFNEIDEKLLNTRKEIKNVTIELGDKLKQLRKIHEQLIGKLQQDIADARTYLSDKQSSHYVQLSEEVKQRIDFMNSLQSEKYNTLQDQFVRNHNEVKEKITSQGQVSRAAFNEIDIKIDSVRIEIKNQSHELINKLKQLEEIREQVSEKLQQDIADAKTYLSVIQSSQYEQLSEELKHSVDYMDTSLREKYKTLQEQFVKNHNEVKEQITAQGQVNEIGINEIDKKLDNVRKEIANETYELVDKLNQVEEFQKQVSENLQLDLEHAKAHLSDKHEQLSEEIKQSIDHKVTLQSEKFKTVQELIVKNHNETQEQLELQGQVSESSDKKLEKVMEEIKSLKQLDNLGSNYPPFFKLGDRIILYSDGGKTLQSGVFIHETNLSVIWVNDSTHRLCLTNKKGLSIVKE